VKENIKCLIVDDEPLAIDILKGYLGQVPQLELVGTCQNAIEAFQVLQREKIDLLFLDIEMPELSGMELAKSLPSTPSIIFTTAYRDYAIESYELDIVDYLLKPISFNRFFKAISKYIRLNQEISIIQEEPKEKSKGGSIYVYADKKNHKVYFDDILYVESIKDYVRVHTPEKNIITKDTITHYEKLLPTDFLRVHRSFIINKSKITAFTTHDIEIGEKEIPIGVSYKKSVVGQLKG